MVPVLLYSVLYNIPKFFELSTSCPETEQAESQGQNSSHQPQNTSYQVQTDQTISPAYLGNCKYGDMVVTATDMR